MKKTLLTILGLAGAALAIQAAESPKVGFTYAGDDMEKIGSYGSSGSERQSMAIKIEDPALKGYKITKIMAYMNENSTFTNPEIWLSSELQIENSLNTPDILSDNVEVVAGEYGGFKCKVLEYTLKEPYVIGDEGVFVGSSITTTQKDIITSPFLVYESMNAEGLWYRGTTSSQSWTDMSSTGQVALIVAILEGESDITAINLNRLDNLYVKSDSNFSTTGYVSNVGGKPVNSIEYSYTVDGEYAGNGMITFTEPLIPNPGKPVELSFEFNGISSWKQHTVEVTIEKVNGEANMSANPTAAFASNVVPFVPVHRPLVEEFTGLWCQYCPRGYVAMEEVNANYGDLAVVACYHNGDEMTVTDTYPVDVTGFPKASVDRVFLVDPYNGFVGWETDPVPGIFNVINTRIEDVPEATIDVTNVVTGDFGVKFDIETVFCVEPSSSSYELGYLLTANGLSDPTWGQVNAYSGKPGFEGTPLEMFVKLPPVAYDLVYNDVVVNVDAMNGIPGSLPSVQMGAFNVYSVTVPMSSIHITDDLNSLVVNAFIINKKTGNIVNANKAATYNGDQPDNPDAGIEEVDSKFVVEKEYFDISGRRIETPAHGGIYIVKSRMEDGSIKTEKRVIR